ncbi:conserved hypothetical protein [Ricinus communis]|uniref:Secreted protein n=1 Tax=Ricinus communis TaxID=3988 RepID=B9SBB1_RICCO|nr:conserved hypothetical protein [Ricinus communis]
MPYGVPRGWARLIRAILVLFNQIGRSTSLARGWDSFTCISASTTKSSSLNALTTLVQPFLEFIESGFPLEGSLQKAL